MNTQQWRIQDFWKGGSNTLLRAKRARIFRSHAHFWTTHAHFRSFLRQSTSSTSPIDLFSNEFLLKHSKVSHSSSFLSSVARKGGSIYLSSVYFLVLGVAKRGVPVHPWIPLWIRHCSVCRMPSSDRRKWNTFRFPFQAAVTSRV